VIIKISGQFKLEDRSFIEKDNPSGLTYGEISDQFIDPNVLNNLNEYLGTTYANPVITSSNCSFTILMMDPRIGEQAQKPGLWHSLESTVSNIHSSARPNACILLQTSSCSNRHGLQGVQLNIWRNALPQFKSMIRSGNVRVTILDHNKYNFWFCNKFYSHSSAWINIKYWSEEFIFEDSDLVLSVQGDSVLCQSFNPNLWRDVAWVGGVWPPEANTHTNPVPPEGLCNYSTSTWNKWNKNDLLPFPEDICTGHNGKGPVGNGGLTIRSRKWLKAAIRYCPHPLHSSLSKAEISDAKCVIPREYGPVEDLYFATILRGIRAPLPTAFEASLFSVEMIFAEDVLKYYSTPTDGEGGEEELEEMVVKRWGNDDESNGLVRFRNMRKGVNGTILPIGFHKPYLYHSRDLLLGQKLNNECKYLHYILPKVF